MLLLCACALCACTSRLDTQPPQGFDLSGTWQLVRKDSDPPPSTRHLRHRGGMLAFVTSDFPVLRARTLQIEQNQDSMGIRYDTGDYRDVSWGTREHGLWKVTAGWRDGTLTIVFHAHDGDAREVMTLSPDGRRLSVDVRVDSRGGHVKATRVYRRADAATQPT